MNLTIASVDWGTYSMYSRETYRLDVIKMLWTIIVILFILWLLGFSFNIAGGLIHILIVVALVLLVFNLLSGRRS